MNLLPTGWAQQGLRAKSTWAAWPAAQRRWLALAAMLLAVFVVGLLGLAPALATWRDAPAKHQQLDAQLQAMQFQAQSLQTLQNLPRADPARIVASLTESLKPMGEQARLTLEGTRATVQLQAVPADALANWLSSVRLASQAVPIEAELNRDPSGSLWDGRVVLALPEP